jgi:hypothetical protein
MSIFGQVWLWSAAAFVIGVLLTWLMLVRPAQARSRALERRLRALQSAPRVVERPASPPEVVYEPEPEPGPGVEPEPYEPERFPPPSEPEPFEHLLRPEPEPVGEHREPAWFDRDSYGEPVGNDDEYTAPVRHGEFGDPLWQPEQEQSEPQPSQDEFAGLSSVLEPALAVETTSIFNPVEEHPVEDKGSEHGSLFEGGGAPEYALPVEEPEPQPPVYAFGGGDAPGNDESAAETTQVLPRRQPRQSSARDDSEVQLIQPSMRAIEPRDPVDPDEGGRSGSLFEPAVRSNGRGASAAEDAAPEAPPARPHQRDSPVPPGPFGPGSAMPRPGGGRPTEEFTVKASVTALRYCTEESPQFARMVAEVWFRTTADAERVGFRPLT